MSTELVAIEKIEIRHGDKNADEIRMELVKYLRQFLDSASIESMALHDLAPPFIYIQQLDSSIVKPRIYL